MGKHRYSSVDFNRVDWEGLSKHLAGTRAVWAVDVAKERYFATLLDVEHQVLVTCRADYGGTVIDDNMITIDESGNVNIKTRATGDKNDQGDWDRDTGTDDDEGEGADKKGDVPADNDGTQDIAP